MSLHQGAPQGSVKGQKQPKESAKHHLRLEQTAESKTKPHSAAFLLLQIHTAWHNI